MVIKLAVLLIRSQLYGISPVYPVAYIAVCGMLLIVSLIACFVPARRATQIDPVKTLFYK